MKILSSSLIIFWLFCLNTAIGEYAFVETNAAADSILKVEIGDQAPSLVIPKNSNSTNKKIDLSDFKGKLLILDFFATWCVPCVANIPKNNQLQEKYKDELQFLMITKEDDGIVDGYFKRLKALKNIENRIPIIYDQGTDLHTMFPHFFIPHYVWIDPDGNVIATTRDDMIDEKTIEKVIKREKVDFVMKNDREKRKDLDPFFNETLAQPLFINKGKWENDSIEYKSVMTGYIDDLGSSGGSYTGRLLNTNSTIARLYIFAYNYSLTSQIGPSYLNRMVNELTKPERIIAPQEYYDKNLYNKIEEWYRDNSFVYDLVLPDYYEGLTAKEGTDSIRILACEIMKQDLASYFTDIDVKMENREVDCLILECIDSLKLASMNTVTEDIEDISRQDKLTTIFVNQDIPYLKGALDFQLQSYPPIVDETNYKGKINFKLDFTTFSHLNEQLKSVGLQLVKGKRSIDMLVFKDR